MSLIICKFYIHFSPILSTFCIFTEETGSLVSLFSPDWILLMIVTSHDFLSSVFPVNCRLDLGARGDSEFLVGWFANSLTGAGVCPAVPGAPCLPPSRHVGFCGGSLSRFIFFIPSFLLNFYQQYFSLGICLP